MVRSRTPWSLAIQLAPKLQFTDVFEALKRAASDKIALLEVWPSGLRHWS